MRVRVFNHTNCRVKLDKESDGSGYNVIIDEPNPNPNVKEIGNIPPGTLVKIGEREYIVLGNDYGYEQTTAVITREAVRKNPDFGHTNDYITSYIRQFLNTKFFEEIAEAVGESNIIKHRVDLEADDGTDKGAYCIDKVSLMTAADYRHYREFIDGGQVWWTATKMSAQDNYSKNVVVVCSSGILGILRCQNSGVICGVRPFLFLKSDVEAEIVTPFND